MILVIEIAKQELVLMKYQSPIQSKSYKFSILIINLYQKLQEKNEFVLARQILKSGTSIGANVEEAVGAQSGKDFFMKITIAYKEARETNYWLRLLRDCNYIDHEESLKLINDIEELLKLLTSIQKTVKRNRVKSRYIPNPLTPSSLNYRQNDIIIAVYY